MDGCFGFIELINENRRYIREDKTHIKYSFYSVYLHLTLFIKDMRRFKAVTEIACLGVMGFDFSKVGLSYFQTCANVARTLGFYIVSKAYFYNEKDNSEFSVLGISKLVRQVFLIGLKESDLNFIKHIEFRRDYRILESVCRLNNAINQSDRNLIVESIELIFKHSVRPEGEQKVMFLNNFFLNELKPVIETNINKTNFLCDQKNKKPILNYDQKTLALISKHSIAKDPGNLREIALAFEQSGDVVTALIIMEKALQLRPTGPFIKRKVAEYRESLKRQNINFKS